MRALLLDLDGTLLDTAPELAAAAHAALDVYDIVPVATVTEAGVRFAASSGAHALLAYLSGREPQPQWVDAMLEHYAATYAYGSRVYAGWEPLLHRYPWAVVTNKPKALAAPMMAHLWPQGYILVTPEDAGTPKPDPAGVRLALARLGVAADAAVFVGDDRRDAQAAVAAGVSFVLAAYGYGAADSGTWNLPMLGTITRPGQLATVLDAQRLGNHG